MAVKYRLGLGRATFEKSKLRLTSKRVLLHIKSKIYNTYILPVILYGFVFVNWTTNLFRKTIETLQNRVWGIMTNYRLIDHI